MTVEPHFNALTFTKSPWGLHYDAGEQQLTVALNGKNFTFDGVDPQKAQEFAEAYCAAFQGKLN